MTKNSGRNVTNSVAAGIILETAAAIQMITDGLATGFEDGDIKDASDICCVDIEEDIGSNDAGTLYLNDNVVDFGVAPFAKGTKLYVSKDDPACLYAEYKNALDVFKVVPNRAAHVLKWQYRFSEEEGFKDLTPGEELPIYYDDLYLRVVYKGIGLMSTISLHTDGVEMPGWDKDDGSVYYQFVKCDDAYCLPELKKDGAFFEGWYTNPDFTGKRLPAGTEVKIGIDGVHYYAKFTYKVTFEARDGFISELQPEIDRQHETINYVKYATSGTEYALPEAVKHGFTFEGWCEDSACQGTVLPAGTMIKINNNKTYYAKYEVADYDVGLVAEGGTVENWGAMTAGRYVKTVKDGGKVTLPTVEKAGNYFVGWYTNPNYTGKMLPAGSTVTVTGNRVYYAKFDCVFRLYANGGTVTGWDNVSGVYQKIAKYGDKVTLPAPVKEGYVFEGWYDNSALKGNKLDAGTVIEVNRGWDYCAKYTPLVSVTLHAGGGTVKDWKCDKNGNYVYIPKQGSTVILPEPKLDGYTFKGWYTDKDFTGTAIAAGTAITATGNLDYYAKWEINNYTTTIQLNGGKVESDVIVGWTSAGDNMYKRATSYYSILFLPIPQKPDMTFVGWYSNPDFTGEPVGKSGAVLVEKNATYYARYASEVHLDTNGGKIRDGIVMDDLYVIQVADNSDDSLPTPEKDGYTFMGWYDNPEFKGKPIIDENLVSNSVGITLYARWE